MQNFTGQVIKGYELRESIGSGGFGAVYRAFQPILNREVAIKIILPEHANQPDFIRSFEVEAQIVAHLEHPYIVPLYDFWRDPEGAYLVMRWIRGGSLRKRLKEGPLTQEETARMLSQITAALHIAHRNGIVHRDLKPENILLDNDGNAYLTDFGIARVVGQRSSDENISGTLQYVSPEELQNQPWTPQADIYSLGIMVFEMLVGKHPFKSQTPVEILLSHLHEYLPSVCEQRPELPLTIDHLLEKATAKKPADRHADVRDIATEFLREIAPNRSTQEWVAVEVTNPYKGLRAFQEADAGDFFGRERLVSHLVERMKERDPLKRFLAVIGPSGSGKSSVVMAGLIPALRRGAISGSENWFIVTMVPGAQPIQKLEAALLSVAQKPPENLAEQLRADNRGLLNSVETVLAETQGDFLLVIDQFEEIFTQVEDPAERAQFLELLRVAVSQPDERVRVVITMRADFTDRPLSYPEFGELLRTRVEFVLPLTAVELEKAIVEPARRIGITVQPEFIAAVVSDVRSEPGALPLLQYALTESFERRDVNRMTLTSYQASGGVIGALARRAEEVYSGLNDKEQALTRQIFLRLVALGDGSEDTRRRVSRTELSALGNVDEVNALVDQFGKFRLLTFDRELGTREPTVEIAHEALISQWTLLRRWLDDSRDEIRLQRQLAQAAAEWHTAGHDSSFLLRGTRLELFENWMETTTLALTRGEREFVRASIAHRRQEEASETARRNRESELILRDERRKHELAEATVRYQQAEQSAKEAEAAAFRTGERAKEAEESARKAQRRAAITGLIAFVIGIAAIAATLVGVNISRAAEASRATAEFEAAFINLQVARAQTLIPGVVSPPTAAVEPLAYIATETQMANVAEWTPVSVQDAHQVAMVEVPAGCFVMGSGYAPNEIPPHEICFDVPFWIDQYEVTVEQFTRLDGQASAGTLPNSAEDFPRVNLTWDEARTFCEAQRGARLPTEAEWEYAARGPNSLLYTYGSIHQPLSGIYGSLYNQLQAVGSADAERSWVGASDLLGNVQEWVSSLYAPYPYQADDEREDPTASGERVLRGASYFELSNDRTAARSRAAKSFIAFDIGFRCARSTHPTAAP